MSATAIAQRVGLTLAPVKRRIDRLESDGVITGYTVVVNHERTGIGFEAIVELRFAGNTKVESMVETSQMIPEVMEVFAVAGDADSLVRIRVDSVRHLQSVVDQLRRNTRVTGTKTLIILNSWRRTTGPLQKSTGGEDSSRRLKSTR